MCRERIVVQPEVSELTNCGLAGPGEGENSVLPNLGNFPAFARVGFARSWAGQRRAPIGGAIPKAKLIMVPAQHAFVPKYYAFTGGTRTKIDNDRGYSVGEG
jgi:hypothetical protein